MRMKKIVSWLVTLLMASFSPQTVLAEAAFSDALPQFSCSVSGQTKPSIINAADLAAANSFANAFVGMVMHNIPPSTAACRPVAGGATTSSERLRRFTCKVGTIRNNVRSFRRSLSRNDEFYEVRARDLASALSVASALVANGVLGRPLDFAACEPNDRRGVGMVYSDSLPLFSCVVGSGAGESRTFRNRNGGTEPERIQVHASDANSALTAMSALIGFDKLIGQPPVSFARCEPVAQVTQPAPPVSQSPATTGSTQPGR